QIYGDANLVFIRFHAQIESKPNGQKKIAGISSVVDLFGDLAERRTRAAYLVSDHWALIQLVRDI
ncbi:MAG: hypothetical protein ACKO96_04275, partial [Flammeovirgaceae bacterium]